jgi:hypothetical protein
MARHKKGFWSVLADRLDPQPTKPPARPQQAAQSTEKRSAEDWASKALRELQQAHDAETFQVAAATVYSMIAYEKDNGWVMTPYLPDLILNLGEVGGEIGAQHPETRDTITWCMGQVAKIMGTYDPPEHVQRKLDSMAPNYAHVLVERTYTIEDRPAGLRGAAEIIAWHKVHKVPLPKFRESPEDVLDRARQAGRA